MDASTHTHVVSVTIKGRDPHGPQEHSGVTVEGDGSIDHILQAFAAALVAAGFATDTAAKLVTLEA